jgi:hypothetical protein
LEPSSLDEARNNMTSSCIKFCGTVFGFSVLVPLLACSGNGPQMPLAGQAETPPPIQPVPGGDASAPAAAAGALPIPAVRAARATNPCSGEYSTAVFKPLPVPTVVRLDLQDSSSVSMALANAFTAGMSAAGLQAGSPSTVKLTVTYNVLGQGGAPSAASSTPIAIGSTDTGWGTQWGNSQTWLDGGWSTSLPDLPRYDMFYPQPQAQPQVQSALLVVRVVANSTETGVLIWIASVQCRAQGSDNRLLAFQLGRLVGGSFGKRVSRGPM